jgi:hypothetical protein
MIHCHLYLKGFCGTEFHLIYFLNYFDCVECQIHCFHCFFFLLYLHSEITVQAGVHVNFIKTTV